MFKTYSRIELKSLELSELLDHAVENAIQDGNGEAFEGKYDPHTQEGETYVALMDGRLAGIISAEPSTYTGDPDIAIRACRLHIVKEYRTKQIGFYLWDRCYWYAKENNYKVVYFTHHTKSKAMNEIYQHKKKSLFKGAKIDPYKLVSWNAMKLNKDYLFKVDPNAEFYQNIYYSTFGDYTWEPKKNIVEYDESL